MIEYGTLQVAGSNFTRVISKSQATFNNLLTYCVVRPTQPPTSAGREMSSSIRNTGWRHSGLIGRVVCGLHRGTRVHCSLALKVNKKAVLSQRWPRNAPYIWVPWKFSGLPDYALDHYSQHFHGLLFRSTLWMFLHNLKSVALPVPEIIGGTRKNWADPGYAHVPFCPKFWMGFYLDCHCKCTRQIWSP